MFKINYELDKELLDENEKIKKMFDRIFREYLQKLAKNIDDEIMSMKEAKND